MNKVPESFTDAEAGLGDDDFFLEPLLLGAAATTCPTSAFAAEIHDRRTHAASTASCAVRALRRAAAREPPAVLLFMLRQFCLESVVTGSLGGHQA